MGVLFNSGLAFYKVSSFLLVVFLLIINFRRSPQYAYFVYLFKSYFIQLFITVLSGLLLFVLYLKHPVSLLNIVHFFGSGYKTISFIFAVLILFLYLYRNNKELISGFFLKHITIILSLTGIIVGGKIIYWLLTAFRINVLDILVFVLPFYEYFTFGALILLLVIAVIQRRMQLVVVQGYFYLFVYFIFFVFVCSVAVSAIYSFDLVKQFFTLYLAGTKTFTVNLIVLLYSISVFNLITILFLGFVLVSRIVKTIVEIISKHLQSLYQNYIISWIYDDPDSKGATNAFRNLSRSSRQSRYRRNLILKELVSIYKNLSGDIALRTKELYYDLKLTRDTLRILKYGRWPEKIKALQVAAYFDYQTAIPLIQKLITSRNELLRMEAKIAMIKLNKSADVLLFLKSYNYPLSEYEYIHIMTAIGDETHHINVIPLFESQNETVVVFALKLSGLFGQVANYDRIIDLLRHGSPKIREAAIFALGQLSLPQSVGPLMDFYQIETYRNKINILEVIQRIPVETCQAWLVKIIQDESDFAIRLAALKALQNTNRAGEDIIESTFVGADEELCSLIRHIRDKRI